MKVAISSQGNSLKSKEDPRFGRSSWFAVIDKETGKFYTIDNDQNLSSAQGAGIQAAEKVSREGVEAVITGHCGPKAFRVLKAAGITVYLVSDGTVEEIMAKFKLGELVKADTPDVEGHWI